tara:strand:+ start:888 stop:1526 length:639 start_codon:yes stop_codon:yes gene_type:complete
MRNIDLLDGVEHSSASTWVALNCFQENFKSVFGIKHFPFVQHNSKKKAIKAAKGSLKMPYAFFNLSQIGVDPEVANIQNIRRMSSASAISDAQGGMSHKVFAFPFNIDVRAVYVADDIFQAISFVERASLVNHSRIMSSKIKYPNGIEYDMNVYSDSITMPVNELDLDSETDSGVFNVELQYQLRTKMVVFKDGPKINNQGYITTGIKFEPL